MEPNIVYDIGAGKPTGFSRGMKATIAYGVNNMFYDTFLQIIANIFAHVKDFLFLCSAKMIVRYVNAATTGGYFCICQIRMINPIGAVTASVSRKAPVACTISHSNAKYCPIFA